MGFLGRARASYKKGGFDGLVYDTKLYFSTELYLAVEAAFSPLLINRVIRDFRERSKGLRTTGDVVDFALRFRSFPIGIRAMQEKDRLMYIANMLSEMHPANVMEIGTAHGGTLFVLSRMSAPRANIISVNLPFSRLNRICLQQRYKLYRNFATRGQTVRIIEGDSHMAETMARVRDALRGSKLDFLFIDGDHSYEGAKMDFTMYSKLVRKGGIVAYDDIGGLHDKRPTGPRLAWDEVKVNHKHKEIEAPGGSRLGVLTM